MTHWLGRAQAYLRTLFFGRHRFATLPLVSVPPSRLPSRPLRLHWEQSSRMTMAASTVLVLEPILSILVLIHVLLLLNLRQLLRSIVPQIRQFMSASSSRQAGDASGYCGRFGLLLSMPILPRILLVGACWLAVSLLYYGLSFAIGACDPDKGCNPYPRGALLALVDVPGNVLAFYLADLPRFGRRTTTAMAFLLGGLCLLLSPLATRYAPPAAHLTLALALIGKTCAAAAFLLVYLFPTELFPTTVRASALGICNIFARAGTMAAPLAANVPPLYTARLGSAAVVAGLLALMLPETRQADGRGGCRLMKYKEDMLACRLGALHEYFLLHGTAFHK